MSLSKDQRTTLAQAVGQLRSLVESEVLETASGQFGLHVTSNGDHVETEDALSLDPTALLVRRELVGAVEYLHDQGQDDAAAVGGVIRSATFTIVNRLLATRVAEAVGILPASLRNGTRSTGHTEVAELFPALDATTSYRAYLRACEDELGHAVPRLFDRRQPTSTFELSEKSLSAAIDILAQPGLDDAWEEPEALGWAYQFFNSEEERRDMRAASAAPRDSRELAVRNQFFTPRYVVDWLVQNTLGRRLRAAGYQVELPLLEGETGETAPLELDEVRIIDPAVGSGHFLVGAYDLLEEAWTGQGVDPVAAAPRILPCLFGVDIDPRAAQVAQAVLTFRARRAGAIDVTAPTIVTARDLPTGDFDRLLADTPATVRDLVDEMAEALEMAPTLGTLLRVEDRLAASATRERGRAMPRLGDEQLQSEGSAEQAVVELLHEIAGRIDASATQRMFAAEATDAVRFVELCRARYDVVLMNPPFGAPVDGTKTYLKKAYRTSAVDLYSAFVARGVSLLRDGGQVGAITNRTGFFLKSFAGWREDVLLPRITCAADLGFGVLQEALVEAAAYVVSATPEVRTISFRSLLREADKQLLADPNAGQRWDRNRDVFQALPNHAVSYWVADSIVKVFTEHPTVGEVGDVRVGMQTSDDFRFVRLLWEVAPHEVGKDQRWSPFAKGGEYAPFHGDLHLVVDWEDDGRRLREFHTQDLGYSETRLLRSIEHYGRPGLTWSRRTASGLTLRALPAGSVFADKGCFLATPDNAAAVAWANSAAVRYLTELQLAAGETTSSGGAARSYEVGILAGLPYPSAMPDRLSEVGDRITRSRAQTSRHLETSPHFLMPEPIGRTGLAEAVGDLEIVAEVDRLVGQAFELDDAAMVAIDEEMGPAPARYPRDAVVDEGEVVRLYGLPIKKLVDHALKQLGGARYLAMKTHMVDRRLELLCHLFRAHPSVILAAVGDAPPPGKAAGDARQLISYLVGVAFGRWDCRALEGDVPDVDPWAPITARAPGMLVSPDGLPSRIAPDDYPLELPTEPLLFDDPRTLWDLASRVTAAADKLGMDLGAALASAGAGARSLEDYLRNSFFSDHISAYSMSRRKSPIYWQLGVRSGDWSVWLYYPELSREMLFAVARTAEAKRTRTADLARQLSTEATRDGAAREIRDRFEAAERLAEELGAFAEVAAQVAQSGWDPDLNDGAVLNAAPFADLFVDRGWRDEATRYRKALKKGTYAWARVQTQFFGVKS